MRVRTGRLEWLRRCTGCPVRRLVSLAVDPPTLVTSLPNRLGLHRCRGHGELHIREHLSPPTSRAAGLLLPLLRPFSDSRRLIRPLLTSRSASWRRPFRHKARSPQVRTRSFTAQPSHLRRLALGHKSFAVACLFALAGAASDAIRVPRLTVFAPCFLPTLGRPRAVALHLPRCGQLGGGLAPPRSRPCWAHKRSHSSGYGEHLLATSGRLMA